MASAKTPAETMYAAPGIGLAATQVNVAKRIVIDTSEHQDRLQVFINPVLTGMGELVETEEGCLSVPGVIVPVKRHPRCTFPLWTKMANPLNCVHPVFLLSVFSTKLTTWMEKCSSIISPSLNATASENSYCARVAVQAN